MDLSAGVNVKAANLAATLWAVTFLVTAGGCAASTADDSAEHKSESPTIEMKGKPLPAFVGTWKYLLGTYTFTKDGKYHVHFDYSRSAGPGHGNTKVVGDELGSWAADDQFVYFKSTRGEVISDAYKISKDGTRLELNAKYAKSAEVLIRGNDGTKGSP